MNLPLRKSLADSYIETYGNQIESMLNSTEFSIEAIISKLQAQIQNLESMALSAYAALGYNGTSLQSVEQQMNNDIQKLQQDVKALNGLDLQKIFLDSLKGETFNFDLSPMYNELLDLIQTQMNNNKEQILENVKEEGVAQLLSMIGMISPGSSVRINSKTNMIYASGHKGAIGKYGGTFGELGESLKSNVADWMLKNGVNYNLTASMNPNLLNMKWIIDNIQMESLLKMKKSEREILFMAHPQLRQTINDNFKRKILTNCSTSDTAILGRVIDRILAQKEDAFWGATSNNMTGILGEIQAGYFLEKLTGKKNDLSFQWTGNLNNHTDFILRTALENFGIQVKNTSLETAQAIEFKKFGFKKDGQSSISQGLSFEFTDFAIDSWDQMTSTFFNSAPGNLMEAVSTILGMNTFNIEYQWSNGMATPESNAIFAPTRSLIEAYSNKAQQLMALFSASMMYMQMSNIDIPNSNTLYFIAGSSVISAASILSRIVNQLQQQLKDFQLQVRINAMRVADIKAFNVAPGTIVNYFNAQKGSHHNLQVALQSSFTF